jgi:hypothetical protein
LKSLEKTHTRRNHGAARGKRHVWIRVDDEWMKMDDEWMKMDENG